MDNMNKAKMINVIHNFSSLYFIFGWLIPSQRVNLVLLIPTLQYQFVVDEEFSSEYQNDTSILFFEHHSINVQIVSVPQQT